MTKKANPLQELHRFGVSVWYDYVSRELINSGALARLIKDDGLRGLTSNPTIFEKAIGSTHDYDEEIRRLAHDGKTPAEIFEALAVEDLRAAADLFRPLYESSKFRDGFVSLELPPALARDAKASHQEALRLYKLVDRPNLMIKIPGTLEGLEAVAKTIEDGVPVNVTLLFSQQRYEGVVNAFIKGCEARAKKKKDLSRIASVASFFVSRVDSAVDPELDKKGKKELLGKAAVANAKMAYQTFKTEFASARWKKLEKAGAQPQRLLWASTGTKNPAYSDVLYVEELVGDDTVNTMPPATVDAFRDHGVCRPSLEKDVIEAAAQWAAIGKLVDLHHVVAKLEHDGLLAFEKSFETLLGQIAAKKELIAAEEGVVDQGLAELSRAMFAARLWQKDATLWKKGAPEHQKIIKNSLGWLTLPDSMAAGLGSIRTFVNEIQKESYTSAVVLGMGGSSLACEVFRTCFPPVKGFPRLEVLDNTNPGAVAALEKKLDLRRALFIVASKSGSTIEPNCFYSYFFAQVEKLTGAKAGRQFVAITDPGTSLEKEARGRGFRKIFTNPADVGGRFSALSYFGLVPAAVMGVDVEKLLSRARAAARDCGPQQAAGRNPGLRLGAALGRHARAGQDKLTLSLPPSLESFGLWIEQLIAESTGKEGKGILPVAGEPAGGPGDYADDRLFARLELPDSPDRAEKERLAALERAGRPVLSLPLADVYDLGAQFLIWEVATAAAGFLLGVDPFDQPDVQSAKDQTKALLGSLKKGKLPDEKPLLQAGGLSAQCDAGLLERLHLRQGEVLRALPLAEVLGAHLDRMKPGDYFAILAYLEPTDENRIGLEKLRAALRRLGKAPVVLEFGPRYLHSTGQLYKGGTANGVYLFLTGPDSAELPVPGQSFSFATLCRAQARGDFAATLAAGRRALRLDLSPAGAAPLRALENAASELAKDRPCPR